MSTETKVPPQINVDRVETEPPIASPRSVRQRVPNRERTNSVDLDDYFVGPRAIDKHSKWPWFMRMHGSILPKMILPLAVAGGWATLITCISKLKYNLGIDSILLTVLGFVVGLALSFRSSTAYERYAEGRKYWAQLIFNSNNLARMIWVHSKEREGELGKQDLLAKMTGLNLIVAFSVALKHKLRFEPQIDYEDLRGLIEYLDTFAKEADDPKLYSVNKTPWKATGEYLGMSFAESNPRKLVKRAKKPLGNLPLEILNYLAQYIDSIMENGNLELPIYQAQAVNTITAMNDALCGVDRVLNTPLPVAYSIAFSQITWVYVLSLPFQLYNSLIWITIPGTMMAAYIILGIALIGREIENPFGNDVNDLPLDMYCDQIATDINIMASAPTPKADDFMKRQDNLPLWPLSQSGYQLWEKRGEERIREALKLKANIDLARPSVHSSRPQQNSQV